MGDDVTDFSAAELSAVWEVAAAGAALVNTPDKFHWDQLVAKVALSAVAQKARVDRVAQELLAEAGME